MTTIIGFIDLSARGLREVDSGLQLPVGFLEDGRRVNEIKELANCKLIFLDDKYDYKKLVKWNCFQVKDKKALLSQHNTNSDVWEYQEKWLSDHGWEPQRIDSFSHGDVGTFMKTTKKLLCNNNSIDCHKIKEIIASLVTEYVDRNSFKLLDNYIAWAILHSLTKDEKKRSSIRREANYVRDKLSPHIKNNLPEYHPRNPLDLTCTISAANEQSLALIQ